MHILKIAPKKEAIPPTPTGITAICKNAIQIISRMIQRTISSKFLFITVCRIGDIALLKYTIQRRVFPSIHANQHNILVNSKSFDWSNSNMPYLQFYKQ